MTDGDSTRTLNDETIVRIRDALRIGLTAFGEIERLSPLLGNPGHAGEADQGPAAGYPSDRHLGCGVNERESTQISRTRCVDSRLIPPFPNRSPAES